MSHRIYVDLQDDVDEIQCEIEFEDHRVLVYNTGRFVVQRLYTWDKDKTGNFLTPNVRGAKLTE